MLGTLAVGALEQGRWDEAADISAEVVRSASAAAIHRAPSLVVLGLVRARRGDPEIWPVLDEALALAEPIGELQRLVPVAAARAEAALLEGRPDVVGRETEASYALALERGSGWEIGELAWLRRQAGIDEPAPEGAAEPWALMLAADWSDASRGLDRRRLSVRGSHRPCRVRRTTRTCGVRSPSSSVSAPGRRLRRSRGVCESVVPEASAAGPVPRRARTPRVSRTGSSRSSAFSRKG